MKKLLHAGLKLITAIVLVLLATHTQAQLADEKCNFLGNIIAGSVPTDFNTYWNQVSPENSGKWESAEPTRDVMNWTQLEMAYNFAKDNGQPFKQHTFVWGSQEPSWIGALTAEEQKAEVEEWIESYCTKFPETDMIDVVNEPLHAKPSYRQALGGDGVTGWDWVIWSFETAREHCPNAKLLLNDYGIINNNSQTTNYLTIINLLKERDLIDGIGEQAHGFESISITTLRTNLDKLHATGLPIYISEYDVDIADDNAQKAKYEEQFPMFWNHPGVRGITLWGYKQGQIWKPNAYLVRSNGTKRPALTWLESYVPSSTGGTFCLPPVGAEADEEKLFKVYPNPAVQSKFTVHLAEAGRFNLDMLDYNGKVVYQSEVKGGVPVEITPPVSSGFFILKVHNSATTFYKKLVIN
ncbi:MAG TPA: endo-1,4-beta-xylanase [Ohtaekwangia sp.]